MTNESHPLHSGLAMSSKVGPLGGRLAARLAERERLLSILIANTQPLEVTIEALKRQNGNSTPSAALRVA